MSAPSKFKKIQPVILPAPPQLQERLANPSVTVPVRPVRPVPSVTPVTISTVQEKDIELITREMKREEDRTHNEEFYSPRKHPFSKRFSALFNGYHALGQLALIIMITMTSLAWDYYSIPSFWLVPASYVISWIVTFTYSHYAKYIIMMLGVINLSVTSVALASSVVFIITGADTQRTIFSGVLFLAGVSSILPIRHWLHVVHDKSLFFVDVVFTDRLSSMKRGDAKSLTFGEARPESRETLRKLEEAFRDYPGVKIINNVVNPAVGRQRIDHLVLYGHKIALIDSQEWEEGNYDFLPLNNEKVRVLTGRGRTTDLSDLYSGITRYKRSLPEYDVQGFLSVTSKHGRVEIDNTHMSLVKAAHPDTIIRDLRRWFRESPSGYVDLALLKYLISFTR